MMNRNYWKIESINDAEALKGDGMLMMQKLKIWNLATLVLLAVFSPSSAQTNEPPQLPHAQPQHDQFGGDPIRQLNLTPEQRERIRTIREESREERARINQRLRDTNRALEDVLSSDNPDEAVVEERVKEVVAAQSAAMRLRILTEVRIRRVLTLEQKMLLRTLRQQVQESRRERRLERDDRQRIRNQRTLRMQNQRNGLGPIVPPTDVQRRRQP